MTSIEVPHCAPATRGPVGWTKDAGEILGQIHRAKTKTNALTDH